MNDQIVTFTADPPPTRWTYAKTALIMLIAAEILNVFAQNRLVQKEEYKISSIIVGILSLVISYFLTRSPLTKSLTIDYVKQQVVIGFATLTKPHNLLEIPFSRLGVDTDAPAKVPADATSPAARWRTRLLLDGKEVYLLLSSETGFTAEQMNEFNDRVRKYQEER
jgi:hypothetical protein